MKRLIFLIIIPLTIALFSGLFIVFSGEVYAGNIDPDDKFAYGENAGWLNFEPIEGPGVTVTDTEVTGYAWSENIGWINLSPTNYGGVTNDGDGNLSGYAWGENVGWINFAPTWGGVIIDDEGNFDGWAWGENIGWIHFQSPSGLYLVNTSWTPPPLTTPADLDGDGVVDRSDLNIILSARNSPASGPDDPRDLDGDGMITVLDARKLVLLCTCPRCVCP